MDKDFFVQEIKRNSEKLFRVAYALLRNPEDCRDALQETALKAWEKRHTLRSEQYFATWITRICINCCHNLQRRRKGTVPLDAVAEPFARASLRLRCGVPAEAALKQLAAEMDAPGVDLMATALAISQRTGSPLRELFQRSALLVEQQGEFHRMLQVKTAQVRLSVRIVCVLPVGLVVLLSLISPDFRQGLHTTAGIACLLVGATMDAAALLLIRRILKGVM